MTSHERRNLLLSGAFIPAAALLTLKIPYLRQAWTSSPIDRANMAAYGTLALLAAAAGALAVKKRHHSSQAGGGVLTALLMIVAFVLYGVGVILDINALQLLASIAAMWLTARMCFGKKALFFAPAAFFAALAVPGVIYWTENFISQSRSTPHAAYAPAFSPNSQSGMAGREIPVSRGARNLFKTSEAHQFVYADNPSNCVSVLAVEIGGDIHEIHPASHCMKSAGCNILSEGLREITLASGNTLEVDEVVASSADGKMLVWIWFSSDDVSSGSFLVFRRLFSASHKWRTYQISTPLGNGDDAIDSARERLLGFLRKGGGDA